MSLTKRLGVQGYVIFVFFHGYTLFSKVSWALMFVLLDILDLQTYYPLLFVFLQEHAYGHLDFLVSQCEHNLAILNLGKLTTLVILTYMSLVPGWDSHISIWYKSYSYNHSYTSVYDLTTPLLNAQWWLLDFDKWCNIASKPLSW